jgi:hypothetical protein
MVGRRGGGSIEPTTVVCVRSSTGDSTKLSSTMGIDGLDEPMGATLPNRKGAVWFSALLGLRRMLLVEAAFGRERTGLVTGRFRLNEMSERRLKVFALVETYSGSWRNGGGCTGSVFGVSVGFNSGRSMQSGVGEGSVI